MKTKTPVKSNLNQLAPATIQFAATAIPQGDGSFLLKPGKPILQSDVTPRQAARWLGISVTSMYRLIERQIVTSRRPSPGKILVSCASLERYKSRTTFPAL